MTILIACAIGIGLSLITALADGLIKHAALQERFSGWIWLLFGAILYGLTAFGWFFVLRKLKLSTAGTLYAVSIAIFLALLGVFYFKEHLSPMEIFGMVLAIVSLIILGRFA
jgi:multidrug transporter EmrE-like cation transporter